MWSSVPQSPEVRVANQPLTVIVPIQPGQEVSLRRVLAEIAADPADNPYFQIAKSQRTHFLRLAIMTDPDHGSRLLMTGNYDGPWVDYVQELIALSPGLDDLWSHCQGYSGQQTFARFIQAHSYSAQAFYIAVQGESVASICRRRDLRQTLQRLLDLDEVADYLTAPGLKPRLDDLTGLKQPRTVWQAFRMLMIQVWQGLESICDGICELIRQIILWVVRQLGGILGAPDQPRLIGEYVGAEVDYDRIRTLNEAEVVHGINHLHLLSKVRQGRLLRLKIVLFLVNFAARYLFPSGSLSNIRSIHFAHWSIVDGGKHLLFVTHYDGSFDNYLGDFTDRASDGLNSIWNNVEGYPLAGAQDIFAFKQFFRNDQQLPSQVFYRAYPEVTVVNILRDRAIVQPLADGLDRPALDPWLTEL